MIHGDILSLYYNASRAEPCSSLINGKAANIEQAQAPGSRPSHAVEETQDTTQ